MSEAVKRHLTKLCCCQKYDVVPIYSRGKLVRFERWDIPIPEVLTEALLRQTALRLPLSRQEEINAYEQVSFLLERASKWMGKLFQLTPMELAFKRDEMTRETFRVTSITVMQALALANNIMHGVDVPMPSVLQQPGNRSNNSGSKGSG